MAKNILAGEPLSRNDISILAQLFELSFDYYIKQNSPFFMDYLKALRTLIGLGFTSTLVGQTSLNIYQRYLGDFVAQEKGDFRKRPNEKTRIAQVSAEMVRIAAFNFQSQKYPRYYQDFIAALHYTIVKIGKFTNLSSEAERILDHLLVK